MPSNGGGVVLQNSGATNMWIGGSAVVCRARALSWRPAMHPIWLSSRSDSGNAPGDEGVHGFGTATGIINFVMVF